MPWVLSKPWRALETALPEMGWKCEGARMGNLFSFLPSHLLRSREGGGAG